MCFWRRKKKEKVVEETKIEKKVVEEPKEKPAEKAKPAPKAAPAKNVERPKEEEKVREVKDVYHISLNRDEKNPNFRKWRVRKQGSDKTIKYFDTQAEAIDFAKDLADKADGHIVIHKRDGSIRRQNY